MVRQPSFLIFLLLKVTWIQFRGFLFSHSVFFKMDTYLILYSERFTYIARNRDLEFLTYKCLTFNFFILWNRKQILQKSLSILIRIILRNPVLNKLYMRLQLPLHTYFFKVKKHTIDSIFKTKCLHVSIKHTVQKIP